MLRFAYLTNFDRAGRQGWRVAVLLTACVAAILLAVTPAGVLARSPQLRPNDGHSLSSIELATNWLSCGNYSIAFRGDAFHAYLAMAPGSERIPLRTLPALIAGTTERYCDMVDRPWRNNENSLMLTIAGILWIHPGATLAHVAYALRGIRLALVLAVALVMLRCGVSFWLTLGVAYTSVVVMAAVEETRFYSVYPFLPVLLSAFIASLVLLLEVRAHANLRHANVAAALVGFIAAVAANFRSSYVPILVSCFLLWVVFGALDRNEGRPQSWKRHVIASALQLALFAAGFALFQLVFIRPIDRLPSTRNLSYHAIAHPVVLALALPPNRLASDQGIEWNDRVGLDLAKRIDPGVSEINERYEAALFTYYRRLWREHPREMASLYWAKLRLAGADIPNYSVSPVSGRFFTIGLWPLSLVPHGAVRASIFAILCFTPLLLTRRWGAAPCALVSMAAVTMLLLTFETALILTFFYISHEASAMLFAVAMGLLFYQALVNCASGWARRLLMPRKAVAPGGEPA